MGNKKYDEDYRIKITICRCNGYYNIEMDIPSDFQNRGLGMLLALRSGYFDLEDFFMHLKKLYKDLDDGIYDENKLTKDNPNARGE